MTKASTVDEYITQAPKDVQSKLKELRKIIKDLAPEAEEKLSYGMPYYSYKGRLAYFAFFKNHIGLYAMPGSLDGFKAEIQKYQTGKATLRFPLDQPLPIALIKKLVKSGVKYNQERSKK